MSQLGRAKVDKAGIFLRRGLRELKDYLAQVRQALVDIAELLQSLAFSTGVFDSFASSQVDHVEPAGPRYLLAIFVHSFGPDIGGKNGVRAGRFQVHIGRSDVSVVLAPSDRVQHLLKAVYMDLGAVF